MARMTTLSAAFFAAALLAAPAFANSTIKPLSPVGTWQLATGESRFKVELCGDGTQLCAKLTWLRDDARTPDNLALLNKYVLRDARMALTNKWRGETQYQGEIVKGTITMVGPDTMTLDGCKGALCKVVQLKRL
ncbi:MAG TPA: DUF2147 domain-containing protein [Devosia sp.]|nr:DUF2147 domain-containing protein [Devosia sp.]